MEMLQSDLSFTAGELSFLRQCIDLATIPAKDAKTVAQLQIKIESEIQLIEGMLQQQELEKQRQLEEVKSTSKKKSS